MTNVADADYYIAIEDFYLNICKVHCNPGIIYGHDAIFKTTNAKYPFTHTDVRTISLPARQISFNFNNIFQNVRPNKVVEVFVSSQAVSGSFSLSPWNFQHFNLNEITLGVDGFPVGGNPVKVSFDESSGESSSIAAYCNLFDITGKFLQDAGNGLSRIFFSQGFALYAFNIEPDFDGLEYLTMKRSDKVNLE